MEQRKHKMHTKVHNENCLFVNCNRQTSVLVNIVETLWTSFTFYKSTVWTLIVTYLNSKVTSMPPVVKS